MNHRHRVTPHALFAHPVSANIDPEAVHSAIEELGGEVSHGGHGQIVVKLNKHTHGFHDSRHAFSKDEAIAIRKFLELAGIDPARDYPLDAHAAN